MEEKEARKSNAKGLNHDSLMSLRPFNVSSTKHHLFGSEIGKGWFVMLPIYSFFTYHSLVILLVFFKCCVSCPMHEVICLNPPPNLSVSLRGDVRYEFHFRCKVHLKPLVDRICLRTPTT